MLGRSKGCWMNWKRAVERSLAFSASFILFALPSSLSALLAKVASTFRN